MSKKSPLPDLDAGFLAFRQKLEALPIVDSLEIHRLPEVGSFGPDAVLSVTTPSGTRNIQIEMKSSGEPRYVRESSFRLRDWIAHQPSQAYGVFIAPFISPESREILRKEGMGWYDLAGNLLLSFDGLHVEVAKMDANPFTRKRQAGTLFSPKSARVLRLMMTEPGPWKGVDLASRARVSTGQISKLREALLDKEWASNSNDGFMLTQPNAILESWRDSQWSPPTVLATGYTPLHGKALDARLQILFQKAQATPYATVLLAAHSVARRVAPYARVFGEYFYADKKGRELIEEVLDVSPMDEGNNITIFESSDELLSIDSLSLKPEPLRGTGLIQTYLDLSSMADRGREAADHLRAERLASLGNAK